MANTITNFLVGIGYDTTELERGEREFNRSMEGIRSTATIAGAAMATALIGVGKIAVENADRINTLRLQTNTFATSARDVNNYGSALRSLGGDAGDAVREIGRAEEALSNLRLRGDASTFTELAYAGVNIESLTSAESGGEFMRRLADQFPQLDQQQQLSVQNTLGLSPASVELLRQGGEGYQRIMNNVDSIAGITPELIQMSKDYNAVISETQLKWDGVKNTLTEAVLPSMTRIASLAGDAADYLNQLIKDNPDTAPTALGALGVGAAGATLTAGAGLLARFGVPGAATVSRISAPVGVAAAGGLAASSGWDILMDNREQEYGKETTAGGNLLKNGPLGRTWDWVFDNEPTTENQPPTQKDTAQVPYWSKPTQGTNYAPQSYLPDYNATAVGQTAGQQVAAMPPVQVKSTVQNNLVVELDGRALETKIRDVNMRDNQLAVDDITSTTAR